MAITPHTPPIPAADSKFPVLTTRLADVEPIIRPKVGRKPVSFDKGAPTNFKPTVFGTKKPSQENIPKENEKPSSRAKRRALTAPFVLSLAAIAVIMNFAFMWLLDNKTNLSALVAEKSPILLGEPTTGSANVLPPASTITTMPTISRPAEKEEVEVIPYHRVYDPALIERLEKQNPPASGTP